MYHVYSYILAIMCTAVEYWSCILVQILPVHGFFELKKLVINFPTNTINYDRLAADQIFTG